MVVRSSSLSFACESFAMLHDAAELAVKLINEGPGASETTIVDVETGIIYNECHFVALFEEKLSVAYP
jgi:hypothetical protein